MSKQDKDLSEEIAVLWTNAQPSIAAFISSIVPRFQDVDDILQQVAVAVIKNYDKYDKDRSFVAWSIGIARNEIMMHHRRKSSNKLIFSEDTIQKIAQIHEKESAKFNETRMALNICIKKLKGRSRSILEMRYRSELSISRIAQKLGMTTSSIYTTFHRIRIALRECIDRQISREIK